MRERKETAKADATSKITSGKILRKAAIVFVWLLLWQLAGMLIGNPILFATPLETAKALLENFGRADFWGVAGMTLLRIGAGFFLANHVLFIVQAMVYLSPMDWTVWLGIAVFLLLVYGIGYMLAYWMLRSKFRAIPAGFYAVALISSVATYVLAIMLGHGLWFFISLIGSISFFVSDIMLSYSIFKKGEQKQRHWIMTTYLLGQLLISVGFVLTLLS